MAEGDATGETNNFHLGLGIQLYTPKGIQGIFLDGTVHQCWWTNFRPTQVILEVSNDSWFYHRLFSHPKVAAYPNRKWKKSQFGDKHNWSSSIPIFYFHDSWKKNARFPVHQQFQLGGSFKPFEKYYSNWKSTWHNPYILVCIDHCPKLPFGICASVIYLDLKVYSQNGFIFPKFWG